jgi:hypothetical protein
MGLAAELILVVLRQREEDRLREARYDAERRRNENRRRLQQQLQAQRAAESAA